MFYRIFGFALALLISSDALSSQRIISTDGFVTELLFAFEAQDNLIAVDVTSQLPAGFKPLPNIGYHRNLSAEGLLSLQPSMVIGSEHMGPDNVVQALKAAKIPLLQLSSAKTLDELKRNVLEVAKLLEQPAMGEALTSKLGTRLNQIASQDLKQERIAFLLSMDPAKLRLAGKGTSAGALINLLGATNVGTFENYQNVSAESLLAMKPSTILVAGKSFENAVQELLQAQNILTFSEANKNNKILTIDGGTLVAGLSISAVHEALRIAKVLSNKVARSNKTEQ